MPLLTLLTDVLDLVTAQLRWFPSLVWLLSSCRALCQRRGAELDLLLIVQGVECSPFEFDAVKHLLHEGGRFKLTAIALRGVSSSNMCQLACCTTLRTLSLASCVGFHAVQPLTTLRSLATLNLSSTRISDLRALAAMPSLQRLFLRNCAGVQRLDPLSECRQLSMLHLSGCPGLQDVTPLASCRQLQTLALDWCWALKSVEPIARCSSLVSLNLCGWNGGSITALAGCSTLRTLDLCDPQKADFDVVCLKELNSRVSIMGPYDNVGRRILDISDGEMAEFAELGYGQIIL